MENVNAFYKLSAKKLDLEEQAEEYNLTIKETREKAKREKKGSDSRKGLMQDAKDIEDSAPYQVLKAQAELMNFCINTVFY